VRALKRPARRPVSAPEEGHGAGVPVSTAAMAVTPRYTPEAPADAEAYPAETAASPPATVTPRYSAGGPMMPAEHTAATTDAARPDAVLAGGVIEPAPAPPSGRLRPLYATFHDWRARVYSELAQLSEGERQELRRLLQTDIAQLLDRLDDGIAGG